MHKVSDFWSDARDQQLQMSFTLYDHKRRAHIFEYGADENGEFSFHEVEDHYGFKLSILGDGKERAKEEIMSSINCLLYEHDLEDAVHMSCVSALKNRINDKSELFIGGYMQGAVLNQYSGRYLVVASGVKCFRAAELDDYDQLDLPVLDLMASGFPILPK